MAAAAEACVELLRRRSSAAEKLPDGAAEELAAVSIKTPETNVFATSHQSGCVRDWLKVVP